MSIIWYIFTRATISIRLNTTQYKNIYVVIKVLYIFLENIFGTERNNKDFFGEINPKIIKNWSEKTVIANTPSTTRRVLTVVLLRFKQLNWFYCNAQNEILANTLPNWIERCSPWNGHKESQKDPPNDCSTCSFDEENSTTALKNSTNRKISANTAISVDCWCTRAHMF